MRVAGVVRCRRRRKELRLVKPPSVELVSRKGVSFERGHVAEAEKCSAPRIEVAGGGGGGDCEREDARKLLETSISLLHSPTRSSAMAENGSAPPETTIILPPPAIKTIVDKTAAFIAPKPNAAQLEERFRQREQTDSRFAFLNPTNPYYAYYADRLAAFKAGEQPESKGDDKVDPTKQGADNVPEDDGRPKEPPALEFLVEDPPKISPVDL